MKNQKLFLLLITPFIVMACDSLSDDENCSSSLVLSKYHSLINDYQNVDNTDCEDVAVALDSLISYVDKNESCIATSLEDTENVTDGKSFITESLSTWKAKKDSLSGCLAIALLNAPCGEITIENTRESYKTAYYDAYDNRDCQGVSTALNNYVSYLQDNISCVAQASSTSEVNDEITEITNALPIIEASDCDPDVLKTIGLFRKRTHPSEFNEIQAIAEFYRADKRYNTAVNNNACQSLVLNAEYMLEIYNYNGPGLITAIAEADGISEAIAKQLLTTKMNDIQSTLDSTKPNCNGFSN